MRRAVSLPTNVPGPKGSVIMARRDTCVPVSSKPTSTFNNLLYMLRWALLFLVIAIIAGVFGFTGVAGTATDIARILFFVFLVLLIVSAIVGAFRGKPPV